MADQRQCFRFGHRAVRPIRTDGAQHETLAMKLKDGDSQSFGQNVGLRWILHRWWHATSTFVELMLGIQGAGSEERSCSLGEPRPQCRSIDADTESMVRLGRSAASLLLKSNTSSFSRESHIYIAGPVLSSCVRAKAIQPREADARLKLPNQHFEQNQHHERSPYKR